MELAIGISLQGSPFYNPVWIHKDEHKLKFFTYPNSRHDRVQSYFEENNYKHVCYHET